MRTILLIGALVALCGTAHADDGSGLDVQHRGVEGSAGVVVGDLPFGVYDGGGIGASFTAGYRIGRVLAYAEYDFLSETGHFASGDRARGYLHRGAANLRYDLLTEQVAQHLRVTLWIEAGLGHQYLQWNDGSTIERPDVSFGFAGAALMGGHGSHYFGYTGGIKVIAAHAPDLRADARCAGTCTGTSLRWDVGVLYAVTFPFGR
jgi:hypothetical protein